MMDYKNKSLLLIFLIFAGCKEVELYPSEQESQCHKIYCVGTNEEMTN
jgi:hypothetical protein